MLICMHTAINDYRNYDESLFEAYSTICHCGNKFFSLV